MSAQPTSPRSGLPGSDRNVLVTGASGGIGLCVARGLRGRGYRVFASARKAEDVRALAAEGLDGLALDLDEPASVERAADHVVETGGGRLYGLFNNAGWGLSGAVEDISREALRAQFETNLFGTFELTKYLIPVMRRQGQGRIINNSSILGLVALPYRGPYAASKFALEGLTDALRLELRGSGLHVSLIEPGPIASRFRDGALRSFLAHVDPTRSVHREAYQGLERRLRAEGQAGTARGRFAGRPEAVLKKVVHALESRRPRVRYAVTPAAHIMAVLKRLLPARTLDRICLWVA